MTTIEKVWAWLVYSSSNRENISLSMKGAMGTFLVAISIFMGDINVPLLGHDINLVIDSIFSALQAIVGLVSAILMVVGAIRKVVSTFTGTNDVVLGFKK